MIPKKKVHGIWERWDESDNYPIAITKRDGSTLTVGPTATHSKTARTSASEAKSKGAAKPKRTKAK